MTTYLDPMDAATAQPAPPDMSTMYPEGRPQLDPRVDPGMEQSVPYTGDLPARDPRAIERPEFTKANYTPKGILNLEQFEESKPEILDLEGVEEKKRPEAPSFMKKLDMITTGVHRGVTHFTLKMMSLIPNEKLRGRIKEVDKNIQKAYEEDIKSYGGLYPKIGEVAGEMLATSPIIGPYGKLLQGAKAIGKAAPVGLKTLGKYGASALGGAGLSAATETQRYNPDNPGELLNTEAAGEALSNPASYLAPMVGTKLMAWGDKARALQEGREVVSNLLPRDLSQPGASRKLSQTIFDALPAITGMGKRTQQLESIGDDVGRLITGMASDAKAIKSKDLIGFAGRELQSGIASLKNGQKELWNKPFIKEAVPNGISAIKGPVNRGIAILEESGLPLSGSAVKMLKASLNKQKLTVGDVKNIQSVLGKAVSSINEGNYGGLGNQVAKELSATRAELFEPIRRSLSGSALKDFTAAREYSARVFQMEEAFPQLKTALRDEVAARKLIKSLISPTERFDKSKLMAINTSSGQKATKAARLAKALEDSNVGGKLSLSSFLKKTSEYTDMPELMGDSYKAVQGLNKYLTVINEANQSKNLMRSLTVGATVAGAAGYASSSEDPSTAIVGALVTYPALLFAANNPWAKSAFGALTKDMSKSGFDYMMQRIGNNLSRFGYFLNNNSELQHKDDPEDLDNG